MIENVSWQFQIIGITILRWQKQSIVQGCKLHTDEIQDAMIEHKIL